MELSLNQKSIEITINNAQISAAKNIEDKNNYYFQLKFVIDKKDHTNSREYYTNKVQLKDSLMFFDDEQVLIIVKDLYEIIEIYPLIHKPDHQTIVFQPTIKHIKSFKNEQIDDLWVLTNPSKSFIKLKSKLNGFEEINKNQKLTQCFVSSPKKNSVRIVSPIRNVNSPRKHISAKFPSDLASSNSPQKTENKSSQELTKNENESQLKRKNSRGKTEVNTTNSEKMIEKKLSKELTNKITVLKGEEKDISTKNLNETFCCSFFTVSIPLDNLKTVENSQTFTSTCGHKDCSVFYSYKADIIQRFPSENSDIDINSTIASLCFPKGIKVCFSQHKNQLKPVENFLFVNTNETGQSYYIMTYHFYLRKSVEELNKKYNFSPTKDYLNLEEENRNFEHCLNNQDLVKKMSEKFVKKLKFCEDYYNSDYIYVPMCFCLVSKYPYVEQIEKCLNSIFKMKILNEFSEVEILNFITHLVKEIPVPSRNKRLLFYIPYSYDVIEIPGEFYKNLPITSYNLKILLEKFSIVNIQLIHHLIMLEQKLIFIGSTSLSIVQITESFITLLYPLQWTYPYIPTLSEELLKYLQSPLPFIMGLDYELFDQAKEYISEEEEVFIVDVKIGKIFKFKNREKKSVSNSDLLKNLPSFPEDSKFTILNELKEKAKNGKQMGGDENKKYDRSIRKVFIMSMATMFGNYYKYLSLIDGTPVFNKDSFLNNFELKDKDFMEKLVEGQNFNYFLQLDTKNLYPYFHKVSLRISTKLVFDKKNSSPKRSNSISKTEIRQRKTFSPIKDFRKFIEFELEPKDEKKKNSLDFNKAKNNKSNEYLETFLTPPFFIHLDVQFLSYHKIDIYIAKHFDWSSNNQLERILTNNHLFEFVLINKFINYQIVEVNRRSSIVPIIFQEKRPSWSLEIKLLIENENLIGDYLRSIYTSNNNFDETTTSKILSILTLKESRKSFAKVLYQRKFNDNKSHCLSEKSFEDLYLLCVTCFLAFETSADILEARLITKSLFHYYKMDERKNQYFLFQELKKKNAQFQIFTFKDFWVKWFENDKLEKINAYSDLQNFHFEILVSMSKIMFDLKLDQDFICEVIINNLSTHSFEDLNLVSELETAIKKQFNQKKKSLMSFR